MNLIDQMILSKPSNIIIWTYQDMMEWMSRILDGEMAGADEDFGSEVGQMWLNFVPNPNHKSTQNDPNDGPDDSYISVNDGMDEQDIGWRNGWC
jgi:hypothetical protein